MDIIKQANKIIESEAKDNYKEIAFIEFSSCFVSLGLALMHTRKLEHLAVTLIFTSTFKKSLEENGFIVKDMLDRIETHFYEMYLNLRGINTADEAGEYLHKHFDEHFWEKCIFPPKEVQ